jgi:hypothetical protein
LNPADLWVVIMSDIRRGNESPLPGESERPILPGDPEFSKLPMPVMPGRVGQPVPQALLDAWTHHMINGFQENERMLKSTLSAFMKPYRLTVWLYAVLFGVGLGLFVTAAVIGLSRGNSVVAIAFAGLGAANFLAFFVRQPLQALEANLECITWLGVAFNTYWTRLMYMSDPKTIQADLKEAEHDFRASVELLIAKRAEIRAKRRSPITQG